MGVLYRRRQKMPDGSVRELPTIWIRFYREWPGASESTRTTKETVARRIFARARVMSSTASRAIPKWAESRSRKPQRTY